MKDSAGYGSVVITKAISIVSGLGEAGILVPAAGTGITINAGPDDEINLRGLAIEGAGVGGTGIRFNTGGALTVTNSVIRNLTDAGMDLEPTGASTFTITDTLVSDTARVGIYFYPQGSNGAARATLLRVTASRNQWGVYANGNAVPAPPSTGNPGVRLSISDSTIAHNIKGDGYGVYANGLSYSDQFFFYTTTAITLGNTLITGNKYGVVISAGSLTMNGVRIENVVTAFTRCIAGKPYSFSSYGNNAFARSSDCSLTNFSLQ